MPLKRQAPRIVQVKLAALISCAADLSLSALGGYSLRQDVALLVVVDFIAVGAVAALVWGALWATRWAPRVPALTERAPWFCMLAAAWAPIALVRIWRAEGALASLMPAMVFAALVAVGWAEARRAKAGPGWKSVGGAALASLTALALAVTVPLPGRAMLEDPPEGPGPVATAESPNLLMIVLDTVRADHLGLYGYSRETTPWMDSFAEQSTVFEHAVASSSYTLPTHATLFTGLYPDSHAADLATGTAGLSLRELGLQGDVAPVAPLSDEATTLAEIASEAGIETGAICANSAYLSRFFGLDQGFFTYVDARGVEEGGRPAGITLANRMGLMRDWRYAQIAQGNERYYLFASEINELALKWIEPRREGRFFLFLNYMDAHGPYYPLAGYRGIFPGSWSEQNIDYPAIENQNRMITEQERSELIGNYDSELRYLDDRLAALFAQLEEWGLLENTLVVFVGDHGESFGEHYKMGHAVGIYEPEVRVPLVLRRPGQSEAVRIGRSVAMADVMPTLLDEMGLERPHDLQGESLFDAERRLPIVAKLGRYEREYAEHAIYRDEWKMIRRSDGPIELYDLGSDPGESHNLSASRPAIVKGLAEELDRFQQSVVPWFKPVVPQMDAETLKRLRGLGYVK